MCEQKYADKPERFGGIQMDSHISSSQPFVPEFGHAYHVLIIHYLASLLQCAEIRHPVSLLSYTDDPNYLLFHTYTLAVKAKCESRVKVWNSASFRIVGNEKGRSQ